MIGHFALLPDVSHIEIVCSFRWVFPGNAERRVPAMMNLIFGAVVVGAILLAVKEIKHGD